MKALYRRYRPKSLQEVVGQNQITDVLSRAIKENKIGHAYLFVGPRGTGKTSVARILAHEVNGFPYELEDNYIDIIEIDAASNTGVDNIRDLREKASIAPTKGKYKVYIIDEVHMLSKAASNALLKTLEEPPAHVIFIMATTEKQKILTTILSRSQVFQFRLATPAVMFEHLKQICRQEHINITDEALQIVTKRGGGSFRDSLSLLEQISTLSEQRITAEIINDALGLPQTEIIDRLIFAYKNGNLLEIRQLLAQLEDQGVKADQSAEALIGAIIDSNETSLFPLLDRLTQITTSTSYANVRLLLALSKVDQLNSATSQKSNSNASKTMTAPSITTTPSTTIAPTAQTTEARPASSTLALPALSASSASQNQQSEQTIAPDQQPEQTASPKIAQSQITRSASNSSATEIWQNILSAVQTHAKRLTNYIQATDYELKNNTFTIYARTDFKRKQIEKQRSLISGILPDNLNLEISAETLAKDAELAAIADLMGGGEEIAINE